MPKYMTKMEAKVYAYLQEHKTPVSAQQVSKYFIVSESHAAKTLRALEEMGYATGAKKGNTKFFRENYRDLPKQENSGDR